MCFSSHLNIFCFFSFVNGHLINRTTPKLWSIVITTRTTTIMTTSTTKTTMTIMTKIPCGSWFLEKSRSGLERNFDNLLKVGQGGCCHLVVRRRNLMIIMMMMIYDDNDIYDDDDE